MRGSVESFHETGDGVASVPPLRLITEDHDIRTEARQLGHCRHDEIVLELASATAIEGARHEIAANQLERGHPSPDPDPGTFPETFEEVVIADRELLVLVNVARQIEAEAGQLGTGKAAIAIGRAVAHRAGR